MKSFILFSPCCNWCVHIFTNCSQVEKLICDFFGAFVVSFDPEKDNLEYLHIHILKQDTGYLLSGKGQTYTIKNLKSVAFYLYAVIDKLVEGNMKEDHCVFHGGVIAKDNTAYCIIAPTMSGKSTFVSYFALNGYEYLSDDYIFVSRDGKLITPMILPISLRETTVLRELLQNSRLVSGYNELKGEMNTLLSPNKKATNAYQLTNVIFIDRGENNDFYPMSKGDLYSSLLFNMKNTLDLERERVTIANWVNGIDGYVLSYRDFNFAEKCLESI